MAYTIGMVIVDFFKKMWGFFYLPVLNARLRFFRSGKSKDEANFLTTLKSFISFGGKIVNKESVIKIIRSFPKNPEIASIILNSVSNNNLKASIITELLLTLNTFSDSVIKLFINLGGKVNSGQAVKLFDKEINGNNPDWVYIKNLVTQYPDLKLVSAAHRGQVLIQFCKEENLNAELIENYIRQGADLSQRDNLGYTAFYYTCLNENFSNDIMDLFLNNVKILDDYVVILEDKNICSFLRNAVCMRYVELVGCDKINKGEDAFYITKDNHFYETKIYYLLKLLKSLGTLDKVLHYLEPSFLNNLEKKVNFFSEDQLKKCLYFFGGAKKYGQETLFFSIPKPLLKIIFNDMNNENKNFDAKKIIDNIEIEKFKAAYNKRYFEEKLIQAYCENNLPLIQGLLNKGVNLNCVGSGGKRSLLLEKISPSTIEVGALELLLDKGAVLDNEAIKDIFKSRNITLEVAELLYSKGIDLNKALDGACTNYHEIKIDIINFLLNKGAVLDNKAIKDVFKSENITLEVAELLCSKGIDLNKALDGACTSYNKPNIDIISFLLNKGADSNCITDNKRGHSLLGWVLWAYPNEAVVKVLVENGADLNKENSYGETPLHYAFMGEFDGDINIRIIEFLLEKKANPNKEDKYKRTPLDRARANKNCSKKIIGLLEKRSLEIFYLEEKMFLECKKENSSAEILSQLLDEGVDINKQDNKRKNILYYLLIQKNPNLATIEFLLDKKIKILDKKMATSLLIFLCREGADEKYIKLCLAYEISADDKVLALCWVCFREDVDVDRVKYLLDNEVDLNRAVPNGITALHCACHTKKPNVEVVRLLLVHGANPNKKNCFKKTPLDMVRKNKNCSKEVVELLRKRSLELRLIKKAKELFFLECYKKDSSVKVLECLLTQGADINEKYMDEITALQVACENTSTLAVVQFLWENSNVNNKTEEDLCHAFGFACQNEDPHLPIIKYFLEKIKEKSEMAGHALAYVCYMKNPRIKIVKYLLENKVDLTTHYYEANVTILHLLFLNNNFNPEIIRLLLQYGANPEPEHPEFESPIYLVREADMPEHKKQEILNLLLDNNNQNKLRF